MLPLPAASSSSGAHLLHPTLSVHALAAHALSSAALPQLLACSPSHTVHANNCSCSYLHGDGELLRREEWEAGKAALAARRYAEAHPRPKALLSAGRWVLGR